SRNSKRRVFSLGVVFYGPRFSGFATPLGAKYLSKRAPPRGAKIRATPNDTTTFDYTYYGVIDRGLPDSTGVLQPQGGHQQRLEIQSVLPHNWRFVTDYNQLSSLHFRLAFPPTSSHALNSHLPPSIFPPT